MDLDNGITVDQNAVGVDISVYSQASHIDAMAVKVNYAVLPTPVRPEKRHCENAAGWTRYYPHVYSLAAGRCICVKTDEGRYSMLVIEKPATQASGVIGFRYFTWE